MNDEHTQRQARDTQPRPALQPPVDPERDHIRGPDDAPVTIVEYGDFQCPHCGEAFVEMEQVVERVGPTVRWVFRHIPLDDAHPQARTAALAAEAAGRQGHFWDLHDWLFRHQQRLDMRSITAAAERMGMDTDRLRADMAADDVIAAVDADIRSAADSGVRGTPAFFLNDRQHTGAYDSGSLMLAIDRALGYGRP